MRRLWTALAVCATMSALLASACSTPGGEAAVDAADLQPIIDDWADSHAVADVAVSVRSPSGAFTSAGFSTGDTAPDDSSLMPIGSLTKTMVAATVLLLVEDGTLDLDEPIGRWLPEFPRADEITLRMLLSHTAGVANPIEIPAPDPESFAALLEPTSVAELLATAADSVGSADLPTAYAYSSPGYVAVGAVIEAATGEPLAAVIRARILAPLDLESTYLAWSEPLDRPAIPGEIELPNGMLITVGNEFLPADASATWAAGGVVSSARDTAEFYGALFDDLLAPNSLEAMTTEPLLGIEARTWPDGTDGWYHRGGTLGYTCSAGVSDGWTAVVLTNRFNVAEVAVYGTENDPTALVGQLLAHVSGAG